MTTTIKRRYVKRKEISEGRQAAFVKTVDGAIDIANKYSSGGSIRYQNHLNSQGYYSTVDPVSIAEMEKELRGMYLFLCNLSHQIANEKTFKMEQYGKVFTLTAKEGTHDTR
jgi:hypothetical protein